jgi:hypothetical protein
MTKVNKLIGMTATPAGMFLILFWKDLGATIFLIGAVNFVLYRREINGAVI